MRRVVSKLTAGLALTGAATLAGLALTGPASATTGGSLVDITVQDVLTGNEVTVLNDVTVPVAATVCGLDLDVLTAALIDSDKTDCKALSVVGTKLAWVKK